jgi:hypothetical protein
MREFRRRADTSITYEAFLHINGIRWHDAPAPL